MKWAGKEIRKGLYNVLDGMQIPTYDMIAPVERPRGVYAILGDYSQQSINTKDTFTGLAIVAVEIVETIQGQFGGRAVIDGITNTFLTTIRPDTLTIGLQPDGFKITNVALNSSIGQLTAEGDRAYKEYVNILNLEITFNQL